MKRLVPLVIVLVAIFGCKDQQDEQADKPAVDHTISEDNTSIFSTRIARWLDSSLQLKGAKKTINLEERWTDDSIHAEQFTPDPNFYSNYASVLRWSPDSTAILDIGSYGNVVVKDPQGNIRLEAGEPDSELALIDPKKNERTRLVFVGPSAQIINGTWLDNEEMLIVGTFKTDTSVDTLMWQIDKAGHNFNLYNIRAK